MITKIEGKCQYEGCEEQATVIASGQRSYSLGDTSLHPVGCYCDKHSHIVADEGNPEYHDECPNCHCRFGVI